MGGKWKLLLIGSLAKGPLRLGELKQDIPEISEKMLIRSLKDLAYRRALFAWGEGHVE